MDVSEMFFQFLALLGGGGAIVVVSRWIAVKLIDHRLSKDLTAYKAELARENAVGIERFKSDLRAQAFDRESVLGHLHARRIEVVAELYSKLVAASRAGFRVIREVDFDGEPSREQRGQDFVKVFNDFEDHFQRHRIFLPEVLCADISDFISAATKSWNTYAFRSPDDIERWVSAIEHFEQRVPAAKTKIEASFRELLGVVENGGRAKGKTDATE